jgi:3-hydroxyisobutyrate dehydrogenase-like beta-hydroxyacid dehydrogenase
MIDPIGIAGEGERAAEIVARIAGAGSRIIVHGFAPAPPVGPKSRTERTANLFDLASECEVVIAVYGSSERLRAALTGDADHPGLAAALRPGTLIVDLGMGRPEECLRLAGQLAGGAIGLVECAVLGGRAAIASGTATVLAAGFAEHVERITPILTRLGHVTRAGPQGHARIVAALVDAVAAAHTAARAEAHAIAAGLGVAGDALVAAGLHEPHAADASAAVALALALAQVHDAPAPVLTALAKPITG